MACCRFGRVVGHELSAAEGIRGHFGVAHGCRVSGGRRLCESMLPCSKSDPRAQTPRAGRLHNEEWSVSIARKVDTDISRAPLQPYGLGRFVIKKGMVQCFQAAGRLVGVQKGTGHVARVSVARRMAKVVIP